MPANPDSSTQNTPLAPSVEKAYYRKCIELKRRLNEIEDANDAARVRRVRLSRAVTKMRLERALLLDQLARRMEFVSSAEPTKVSAGSAGRDGAREDGRDGRDEGRDGGRERIGGLDAEDLSEDEVMEDGIEGDGE